MRLRGLSDAVVVARAIVDDRHVEPVELIEQWSEC